MGGSDRRAPAPRAGWLVAAAVVVGACATGRAGGGARVPEGAPAAVAEAVGTHDATVLVWWATACPCVKRYEARLLALRRDLPVERVAMLAVSSNADDTPEAVRRLAEARGFGLPFVFDPLGALADALDVRATPTVVLLDRAGTVRYRGWVDNERRQGQPDRVPYLRQALDALLAGLPVPVERSPVYGCTITRSLGEGGHCAAPEGGAR